VGGVGRSSAVDTGPYAESDRGIQPEIDAGVRALQVRNAIFVALVMRFGNGSSVVLSSRSWDLVSSTSFTFLQIRQKHWRSRPRCALLLVVYVQLRRGSELQNEGRDKLQM
jgi:hypothetical protein